jgi:hypothetical protein
MRIVLTNWKAAFLREKGSGFLAVYAVFVSVWGFVAWIRGSSQPEVIQDVLGFLLLTGPVYAVLRMQRGMVAKPVLFCLPRYRESVRALTFSAALLAGVGWATFGPFPPDMTSAEIYVNLAGGFLTGMALYLALTTARLILSRRTFTWLRRAAIALVILILEVFPMPREAPFVIWPVLMPVLVTFCVFVWIRLGDMECVKRGQRIILEDAIECGPARRSPETTLPWMEKWFELRMERQSYLHGRRYMWGQLYGAIGRLLPYWKWTLGSLLGCAWLLGYMGQSAAHVVFAASGSLAWIQPWPLMSPLVLPGGTKGEMPCDPRRGRGAVVASAGGGIRRRGGFVVANAVSGGRAGRRTGGTIRGITGRRRLLDVSAGAWVLRFGIAGSQNPVPRRTLYHHRRGCVGAGLLRPYGADLAGLDAAGCGCRRLCERVAVLIVGSVGCFPQVGFGGPAIDQRKLSEGC